MPSSSATCAASSGCARPAARTSFFSLCWVISFITVYFLILTGMAGRWWGDREGGVTSAGGSSAGVGLWGV
ncbi:hypothetical protein ACFFX0_27200 [Citricoccus parietis]|uniref:Uncharacterized protein n=1 Tax=Citricoccus parietis TaxID=592307 RepID=A0ABV5G702_9MICC